MKHLITICFFNYCLLFGQNHNVTPLIKNDTFSVKLNEQSKPIKVVSCIDTHTHKLLNLDIYDHQNRFLQKLEFKNEYDPEEIAQSGYIDFVDINCDGNKDIKIEAWSGVTGNHGYAIYLYKPTDNKFYYNDEFSDLPAITVDCSNKTVSSWYRTSSADNYSATYKITKNGLLLISDSEDIWNRTDYTVTTIKRVRRGDKMIVVSKIIK